MLLLLYFLWNISKTILNAVPERYLEWRLKYFSCVWLSIGLVLQALGLDEGLLSYGDDSMADIFMH